MTRLPNRPRRVRKPTPVAAARMPHPSWRLFGETAAGERMLTAEDFWARLGL